MSDTLPTTEMVAREIRRAMLDNPTDPSFNKRADQREAIAAATADVIVRLFTRYTQSELTASAAREAALREAASWASAALATLQEYEKDDAPLPDDHEFGRILESRGSPSFRIRAGHIRKLAAALAAA